MFGAFRVRRILQCAGRVWDPEALLLSVLKQQSSALPNHHTAGLTAKPSECQKALREGAPATRSSAQAGHTEEDPPTDNYRADVDCLDNEEGIPPESSLHQPAEVALNPPLTAPESDLQWVGCVPPQMVEREAPQPEENGEACFTLVAAETNPTITFPEILIQWESFVEGHGTRYAEQLSPNLRRREAAILNLKLEDPVLGPLAGMKNASSLSSEVPKYIADVLQTDLLRDAHIQEFGSPGALRGGSALPPCYGLPHFSAELGDMGYLRALLHQFPRGFPLRWSSTPLPWSREARGAWGEPDGGTQLGENLRAAEFTPFGAAFQTCQTPGCSAENYSFEFIAAQCPDHFGLFLGHLAAWHGHIAYTRFLMDTLGAEFVLREQQCVQPISTSFTWGEQRYMRGLCATQCAVAGHQVALLEWIENEYPSALQKMHTKSTMDALIIAALCKDDRTDVFDFFLSRHIPPINALRTTDPERISAKHASAGSGTVGVWSQTLQDSGVIRLLFAAAEMGNAQVLRWFDAALGDTDVRLLCDAHGATILHHCARGHQAQLLETLLPAPATDCDVTSDTDVLPWRPLNPLWVDVEDDQGRTPAMWCVMCAKGSNGAIAILEVLRKAGSEWPLQRFGDASLLDVATRFVSRHSKLARYLKAQLRPRQTCTAMTPKSIG